MSTIFIFNYRFWDSRRKSELGVCLCSPELNLWVRRPTVQFAHQVSRTRSLRYWAFPQGNCWWPFGYSDAECSSSSSGCQSYSAKSKGRAWAGILGFGIIGSGQVQDSVMAIYGNTFSIPVGYAEYLFVNTNISYNGLGGCFAILGGDAVDFQVAVTDNLLPVANAAVPASAPNTVCLGAGLGPISAFLNGSISVAQLLEGSPQLLTVIDSLEQAYTSNDVAGDFEQLTNVLSDLGALGNVSLATTPSNNVTISWSPIALSPCVYRLTVIPTVALKDFGAGLVGGQLLETASYAAISGIAVPAAGTESACYPPATATTSRRNIPTVPGQ